MNTITHALLPVIAAGIYEVAAKKKGLFTPKRLIVIGIFGAAPDLINPHLSLDARYSSWSHSIWFWALLTIIVGIFSYIKRKACPLPLATLLSTAYISHILSDAVSGGIAWNYPVSPDIVGAYYIHPIWWVPCDVFLFLFAYGLFRVFPNIKKRKLKKLT